MENKIIKVPLLTYLKTLANVAAHVIIFSLLAHYFLPEFKIQNIILIGGLYYLFKLVNYLVASIRLENNFIIYNGLFRRGLRIRLDAVEEIELEGPSQFNSNYMLAFYSSKESVYENKQILGRFPLFWFTKKDIGILLQQVQLRSFQVQYQKRLNLYLIGQTWKYLLVNYLIQYFILAALIIFIIKKY